MEKAEKWYSLDETHSLEDLEGDFSWYLSERLEKMGLDQLTLKQINHETCVHYPCDQSHLLKHRDKIAWFWYGCHNTCGSICADWTTQYAAPDPTSIGEWRFVADVQKNE